LVVPVGSAVVVRAAILAVAMAVVEMVVGAVTERRG
jgi:hypothetical protein